MGHRASLIVVFAAACGAGGDDAPTILELPPRISRACSVISPTTLIGDGQEAGFSLAVAGGVHHVFTSRYDQTVASGQLELEPISLGAPEWSTATWSVNSSPDAAPRDGGGLALAWSETDIDVTVTHRLAVAMLDDTGTQVGAPGYITTEREAFGLDLVAGSGGFALVWHTAGSMQLAILDLAGVPTGPPVTIASGTFSSHLARHGDGYALVLVAFTAEPSPVQLVLLDASGAMRGEPRTLATATEPSKYGPFLASVGAELVAAWVEYDSPDGFGDDSGSAIVRIARIGETGELAGPVYRLQAPEAGIVNVNATLLAVPGALALSWARGDYDGTSSGSVTDYRMNLVQLDPVDLAPVSNIVEVTGPSGLRSAPIASVDGIDVAYLLAVDYHARFDLAAAMVRCEPSA